MRLSVCILLGCLMLLSTSLLADSPKKGTVNRAGPSKAKAAKTGNKKLSRSASRPGGITPGREAAALTFVKEHHPELSELLVHLKSHYKREYYKAIHDLFRVSERLAQTQERDATRYDHELKIWKVRSRIELLAAQLRMSPKDEAVRRQLKDSLREQVELHRIRLESERERLKTRLEKLDSQIDNLTTGSDEAVERQLNQLTRGKKKRPASKRTSSPVKAKKPRAKTTGT